MSELYNRQTSLRLKFYDTCFVIGCGGIGNWVALDLALSGRVSNLVLIDPDTVEESNLNRTIFDYTDIGTYKVDAISKHICMRRPNQLISVCHEYMSKDMVESFIERYLNNDNSYYHKNVCIIDCRDDIYDDCYELNCKLYKVGYDGVEITIDGNPRLTEVIGQRGGSYSVTPSYVCSSQLAAVLVVNDILSPKLYQLNRNAESIEFRMVRDYEDGQCPSITSRPNGFYDDIGRCNDMININTIDIISKFSDDKEEYITPNYEQV